MVPQDGAYSGEWHCVACDSQSRFASGWQWARSGRSLILSWDALSCLLCSVYLAFGLGAGWCQKAELGRTLHLYAPRLADRDRFQPGLGRAGTARAARTGRRPATARQTRRQHALRTAPTASANSSQRLSAVARDGNSTAISSSSEAHAL